MGLTIDNEAIVMLDGTEVRSTHVLVPTWAGKAARKYRLNISAICSNAIIAAVMQVERKMSGESVARIEVDSTGNRWRVDRYGNWTAFGNSTREITDHTRRLK